MQPLNRDAADARALAQLAKSQAANWRSNRRGVTFDHIPLAIAPWNGGASGPQPVRPACAERR
jgi:hypothetical protein